MTPAPSSFAPPAPSRGHPFRFGFVFLFLLALLAAPLAQAQTAKSRSALYTEIDTNLPSTTGAITAAVLRAQLKNVVASAYNTVNADAQPIDADLTAIAALTTATYGRSLLTLADAAALRTTAALVIGTDVQAFDAELTAIAALSSNGLIARTGAGTAAARTLTGTAAEITVTNGDGAAGNPTLSLPAALTFTGKTITGGTFASPTLTTPALGTPSAAVLTSATGLPLTTGVTGTLPVTNGGTGRATSTTAYGLLAAGTTATGAQQTLAAGLTTQVLVGGGASALPVWTTVTGTGSPVLAASPTLTGTPLAPTATTGANTTQIATTAFVNATDATTANPRSARGGVAFDGTASTRAYSLLGSAGAIGADTFSLNYVISVPSVTPSSPTGSFYIGTDGSSVLTGSALHVALGSSNANLEVVLRESSNTAVRSAVVSNFLTAYSGKVVMLTITRSSSGLTIYANGISQSFTDTVVLGSPSTFAAANITTNYAALGYSTSSSVWVGRLFAFTLYNLALTQADVTEIYELGGAVPERYKFGSQAALYTSNFTAGVDGWTEYAGGQSTATGNIDAIAGVDDCLRIARNTTGYIQYASPPGAAVALNRAYRLTFDYYMDASSGVPSLGYAGGFGANTTVSVVEGSWQTGRVLDWLGFSSTIHYFTGIGGNLAVGKNLYIKNAVAKRIGAVVHLDGDSDGLGYQWKDQSTNRLDFTLTATGATFTRAQRTGTVYAALTWAGTHEAKSLLGQIALPLNAVVSSIVTTASVASSGSGLTVGSVTTPALFVAANTYTTARKLHTLATALPAGTATNDLSLVLDPDTAAYTGTIQVAVNYYTSP